MSHDEWERTLALHDRWAAYDLAVLILTLGAGLVLLALGLAAVANDAASMGVPVSLAGALVVAAGLHKEPYQAR